MFNTIDGLGFSDYIVILSSRRFECSSGPRPIFNYQEAVVEICVFLSRFLASNSYRLLRRKAL